MIADKLPEDIESRIEYDLIEGPEKECVASYFTSFMMESQAMNKAKGRLATLQFIASIFLLSAAFAIFHFDLLTKMMENPETSKELGMLTESNMFFGELTITVFMTAFLMFARKLFTEAIAIIDSYTAGNNKFSWDNMECIRQAFMVFVNFGYFFIQSYIFIDMMSVYFAIPLGFIAVISAPVVRLSEAYNIHDGKMRILGTKIADREEMTRIAKIIDEEGEYYDGQVDILFKKEDAIEMLKIITGGE